ncbi:MAG: ATP-dependent helicase [Lachnospiraceae bacterium]|nr:ATP-dependent helicase [Lachnospiraceae bacterium]
MKFDENQIKVIEAPLGSLLVTAGPGAGKTAVLTHRIRYLNEKFGIPYEKILVITFTKAAAVQMKSRFEGVFENDSKVTFCTFHSLFYSILKDCRFKDFSIISTNEKMNILKTVLMDNDIDLSFFDMPSFLEEVSKIKNLGIDLNNYEPSSCDKDKFSKIYRQYGEELKDSNLIDYDDFAIEVNDLFSKDAAFLEKWKNRYDYCLIDEFQDINFKQYEVIKMLFKNKSVFAVGDEDQSIYAFRGSSSNICLIFREDFESDVMKLSTNYRSSKKIVNASMELISNNTLRFDKRIVPCESSSEGVFDLKIFNDANDEYKYIAEEIKEKGKGKSAAILLRTNSIPESLLYYLMKEKVRFKSEKEVLQKKDNEITDDILTYMKLSCKDNTYKNLIKIANKPNRYISRNFLSKCMMSELKNDGTFSYVNLYKNAKGKDYLLGNIFKLERNIRQLSKLDSLEGLIFIFNVLGYDSYLASKKIKYLTEYEELKMLALQLEKKEELIEYFDFLKDNEKEAGGCFDEHDVEICTIHASKGREWDEVYIIDVNEGVIPHKKAVTKAETEEERRLFYVAMTRAKEKLCITCINNASFAKPSVFAEETGFRPCSY